MWIFLLNLQRVLAFKMFSMHWETNNDFFNNSKIYLKPLNRHVSHINADTDLLKPLNNYECTVQLYSCYNSCQPYLINITFNMCEFNGKSKHFYVKYYAIVSCFTGGIFFFLKSEYCNKFFFQGHLFVHNFTANLKVFKLFPIPTEIYKYESIFHTEVKGKKKWLIKLGVKAKIYYVEQNHPVYKNALYNSEKN